MIHDLSGSWCIKGTDESTLVMDSSVPLMLHDPDRSWITDADPDHLKGTHPEIERLSLDLVALYNWLFREPFDLTSVVNRLI